MDVGGLAKDNPPNENRSIDSTDNKVDRLDIKKRFEPRFAWRVVDLADHGHGGICDDGVYDVTWNEG